MLPLDDSWNLEEVAQALYLGDDTVRGWSKSCEEGALDAPRRFEARASATELSPAQEEELCAFVSKGLPRSTREVAEFLYQRLGVVHESRSEMIALLHRLGFEYKRPRTDGCGIDANHRRVFINAYEKLLNSLSPCEAAVSTGAMLPLSRVRTFGRTAPSGDTSAGAHAAGRKRLNILIALDLETDKTTILAVEDVDAV